MIRHASMSLLITWLLAVQSPAAQAEQPAVHPLIAPQASHEDGTPVGRWAARDLPEWDYTVAGGNLPGTFAVESAPMTLDELEQIALANNPTLTQAANRIEALRGECLQAGLYPNPIVGYAGEEIGDEGRGGLQGAFFAQEIVTGGKLRLDRAVLGHEIAMAQQDWEIQRLRVTNDIRTAAYTVQAAQRTVQLNEQLVGIGREGQEVAEQLLAAQEVSRVDVLQARIEYNSARLELENSQNDYRAAWQRLAAVIGVPNMGPVTLVDQLEADLPELSWEVSLDRLLSSSPEMARARMEVQRAECELARECAGRVPNVNVEAGLQYNHASEDTVASVTLAMPLQLFDRNQGNIRRAECELAAARQEVRRLELSLQDRLADSFRKYATAQQQACRYRDDILPDAKDSLDLVREGYRQGEFGYLELLTSQRTYFHVNLAYVESLHALCIGNMRIEGMLLCGALMPPGP